MEKKYLYIHGKGGSADEAQFYDALLPEQVIGLDYDQYEPWIVHEIILEKYHSLRNSGVEIGIIANSIGAYFAMLALSQADVTDALFISPMVDMEQLITDMMTWAGVTEADLIQRGSIETTFGETLSFEYLNYVRDHPIFWTHSTTICYGDNDHLVSLATIRAFATRSQAKLNILSGGEHWFHTEEQLRFLKDVIQARTHQSF